MPCYAALRGAQALFGPPPFPHYLQAMSRSLCRGCGKRFRRLAGHHAKNPACASRHVQEAQLAKRRRVQAGYSSDSYDSGGYSSDGSGGGGSAGGGGRAPSPSPGPLSGGQHSPAGPSTLADFEQQVADQADAPSSLAVQLPAAAVVSGACGLGLSYASDGEGGDSDNESSDGEAEQLAPLLHRLSLENQTLLELRRFLPDGDFNRLAPRLGSLDWNPTLATLTNAGRVKDFLRDVTGLVSNGQSALWLSWRRCAGCSRSLLVGGVIASKARFWLPVAWN